MVTDICKTVLVFILKPHGSVNTVARERTALPRNLCSIPGRGKAFLCYRQLADPFSGYRGLFRQRQGGRDVKVIADLHLLPKLSVSGGGKYL
jgi:hypothetical protein